MSKFTVIVNVELNSTYSDSEYCNLEDLPKKLIQSIWDRKNLEIECSSYTVQERTAFLRGECTLNGKEYSFEYHLYKCSDESIMDSYEVDWNAGTVNVNGTECNIEEYCDESFENMAGEAFGCLDQVGSIYFTEV